MIERKLTVTVEPGLQAGPASECVQKANRFSSEIFLKKGSRQVNVKSIMGLLSLAVKSGDEITLVADGSDDEEAIEALSKFLGE